MSFRSSSLALAAAVLGAGLATTPASAALKNCPIKQSESGKFGTSYVTSLKVQRVSCAYGKRLVRAFHSCRKARGGIRGRCPGVLGYRCKERRGGIRTQFSGRVSCTKGTRRVVHTYTQFTR